MAATKAAAQAGAPEAAMRAAARGAAMRVEAVEDLKCTGAGDPSSTSGCATAAADATGSN